MDIKELKKSVSDGDIKNLYLFYGEEEYLIKLYISQIKAKIIDNPSLEDLNFSMFDEFDEKGFTDAINTLPAFAERKLIVYNQTGIFEKPGAAKEFLISELPEIPDYATVVFREKNIDKKQKKLLSAVEKNGAAVEFSYMTDAQLKSWVNIMMNRLGKKMTVSNIEFLLKCTGSSMEVIENEVKKLCSFSENEVISHDEIDAIVTKSVENRIFELSDAILSKNSVKAYQILKELETLREEPIAICALIGRRMTDIYKVKSASPQNRTPQKLGMKPYPIKLYSNIKINRNSLSNIIKLACECDLELKSSAMRKPQITLEKFIAKAILA